MEQCIYKYMPYNEYTNDHYVFATHLKTEDIPAEEKLLLFKGGRGVGGWLLLKFPSAGSKFCPLRVTVFAKGRGYS